MYINWTIIDGKNKKTRAIIATLQGKKEEKGIEIMVV